MGKIMIALLIVMIRINIALAGIKKGNIEKNFKYNNNINIIRSYEATLGPYYQLWANSGYTYIGKVKDRSGRNLYDTEIGDLAEEYYNSGSSNYWSFDDWLINKGYTLEDFRLQFIIVRIINF
jgi:hypothetical protein